MKLAARGGQGRIPFVTNNPRRRSPSASRQAALWDPTLNRRSVSSWKNPQRWEEMRNGTDCPMCRSRREAVAELQTSWILASPNDPVRGYACLVFNRHAIELHDLSATEGGAFMGDAQRLSSAIESVTHPIKLNYEIHGNTIPHLHMHFFPRYVGDAFEGRPIDPRSVNTPVYAPGEFSEFRERLCQALTKTSAA